MNVCSTKPKPIKPKPKFIITFEVLLKPFAVRSAPVTGMINCSSPPVTGIGRVGTRVGVEVSVGVAVMVLVVVADGV